MIDPRVEVVDVDAGGFGWLAGLLRRRPRPSWHWVLDRPGRPASDPDELLAASGAERVVVIDASAAGVLGAAIAGVARPELTQQEWFARAHDLFWSSPAVRTAPAAPPAPRIEALERLAALCEGGCALLETPVLRLAGWFRGGRLVRLSSVLPSGVEPTLVIRCDAAELEAALLDPDLGAALSALLDQKISNS